MRIAIAAFVALLSISLLPPAHAQRPLKVITYDSLGADSLNVNLGVDQEPNNVKGFRNGSNVLLGAGDWVFAEFFDSGSAPVEFQKGAHINFYWTRATNDTSLVYFILRQYTHDFINPDGPGDTVIVKQSGPSPGMYTWTVPNSGYNTVEVWRDVNSRNPVYLDAIVLVQHGTITTSEAGVDAPLAEAAGFSCYPNPFISSQGTTLRSMNDEQGTYIVMDLLGHEVQRVDATQSAHIVVPSTGTYFIRKRVGNAWVGAPLRVSAQ